MLLNILRGFALGYLSAGAVLLAIVAWDRLLAWHRARRARLRSQRRIAAVLRRIAAEDPRDPLSWPAQWEATREKR